MTHPREIHFVEEGRRRVDLLWHGSLGMSDGMIRIYLDGQGEMNDYRLDGVQRKRQDTGDDKKPSRL
jgi:hypothetical protein